MRKIEASPGTSRVDSRRRNRTRFLNHSSGVFACFIWLITASYPAHAQAGLPSDLKPSGPITLQSGQTISGLKITNPNGPGVFGQNVSNVVIRNCEIGPCGGAGIEIKGSSGVTIENVLIHDTAYLENGVDLEQTSSVVIDGNRMENVASGVYASGCRGVSVTRNRFLNMQGPMPRGQYVQFLNVQGGGNRINCNYGENVFGVSDAEDCINLYKTIGSATDPVQIVGNKFKGGGPSSSGFGILVGDNGGGYVLVKDNILVDTGSGGIGIAGGHHIEVSGNRIFGTDRPFSNVGLYVWNQYPTSDCSSITVSENQVNWFNKERVENPSWNAGNCGPVKGWDTNDWHADIDASIFDLTPSSCVETPGKVEPPPAPQHLLVIEG